MPGIGLVHHHLLHTEAGVQGSDGPLQFSRQLARNEFPVSFAKGFGNFSSDGIFEGHLADLQS